MRRIRIKRPVRIEGDIAYVPLTKGHVAIIDAADAEAAGHHNWRALVTPSGKVYATRSAPDGDRQVHVLLHRQLTGAPLKFDVDHRDGDGLNNRRHNLRVCTHTQNLANTGAWRTNLLGIKGVSLKGARYSACIESHGRRVHLGYYGTAEEAAAAYRGAAKVLHGEFAP